MFKRILAACLLLGALTCGSLAAAEPLKVREGALRAGIIGLDTSHVIAFTKAINSPDAEGDIAGVFVTAGFPGGTADNPSSINRVEGYTNQLRDQGSRSTTRSSDVAPCRRRPAGERRRAAAPGTGQAGDRRRQAAVHR